MRQGIHPDYYQATVTCNCGNTFVTGSTKEDIHVEICSKCHPVLSSKTQSITGVRSFWGLTLFFTVMHLFIILL